MLPRMLCPNCNTPVTAGMQFCPECRTELAVMPQAPVYQPAQAPASQPVNVAVNVVNQVHAAQVAPSVIMMQTASQPGCIAQVLWFLFIGWWASAAVMSLAWICMLTVLGIPLGITLINVLPKVLALRNPTPAMSIHYVNGAMVVRQGPEQMNFLIRALYFILIGWWFSGVWMSFAWAFCCTLIGLPLGFWMFDKTPALLTLKR